MSVYKHYDVVIVGAGIAGAILAKKLGEHGKRVLVLEAGTNTASTWAGYNSYMDTFFQSLIKIPNAPYPMNPNAPQPLATDIPDKIHEQEAVGYMVQKGPLPFRSTYTRAAGGTTLHWLGTCLRMFPEDFKLQSTHGVGLDWPMTYEEMMPYYRQAEREIGVSANVEDQQYEGQFFDDGYVYPMFKIPESYLDKKMAEGINGKKVKLEDGDYVVNVVSTPQGRNSMPNPDYKAYNEGQDYEPVGAVGNSTVGKRCDGNSNCTPICPVQAKYNAAKTLNQLDPLRVDLLTQAVASKVLFDEENGRITGIEFKSYESTHSPNYTTHLAQGTIYVLAAHAIENAKLLLASGIESTSKLVGKNLMDHNCVLGWGLMPERIGSYRGPGSTSSIPYQRIGAFRAHRGAFRFEIGNWGWSWPKGDPYTSVGEIIDNKRSFMTPDAAPSLIDLTGGKPLYGKELRQFVNQTMSRQFRIAAEIEQLADPNNRVTIDPAYKDQIGNYRPVIHYDIDEYTRRGMKAGREFTRQVFAHLGVEDFTYFNPDDSSYLEFEGEGFTYDGAGHLVGTHIMGTTKHNSVVNKRQQCWDHENLFLVGCGNMPTISTSNPTLTMTALTFWAVENILEELNV